LFRVPASLRREAASCMMCAIMRTLTKQDEEHLRLLAIFHNVVAGLGLVFSLFPVIHLVMGILMVTGTFDSGSSTEGPPAAFGWLFIGMAAAFIVTGLAVSTCVFLAGRYLRRRERYTFCLIVAGVMCA